MNLKRMGSRALDMSVEQGMGVICSFFFCGGEACPNLACQLLMLCPSLCLVQLRHILQLSLLRQSINKEPNICGSVGKCSEQAFRFAQLGSTLYGACRCAAAIWASWMG